MKALRIEKVTLNIGAGKEQANLEKGMKLLKMVSGVDPIKTMAKKRIPNWGLRPGLPIGCKITLRKERAEQVLSRLISAKEHKLREHQFDTAGNLAFGLTEYIDIPNIEYNPEIGIMGFEVCVTMSRAGYRIKKRRLKTRSIPQRHRISKEDSIKFIAEKFKAKVLKKGEE